MGKRTPERKQFYADVITTAAEGGINYWAICRNYTWSDDDPDTTSVEVCVEDDLDTDQEKWHAVTLDAIAHGYGHILKGPVKYLHEDSRNRLKRAWTELDAGEIDAGDADNILQLAVFHEIVYG